IESFSNYLKPNEYQGEIDGVDVRWSNPAKNRLSQDAERLRVTEVDLKRVTEHFAHACAKRLKLNAVIIKSSFHDTTTNTKTNEVKTDWRHCTVTVNPGQNKAHLYITGMSIGDKAFDNANLTGESVLVKNTNIRDPNLSIGTLPPM
ncbi:hypothetical protein ACJ73_10164, partial [Blastomyces percursus]